MTKPLVQTQLELILGRDSRDYDVPAIAAALKEQDITDLDSVSFKDYWPVVCQHERGAAWAAG